jgi:hypothetical protein
VLFYENEGGKIKEVEDVVRRLYLQINISKNDFKRMKTFYNFYCSLFSVKCV